MYRLSDILNVLELEQLITDGYISRQVHPTLPLAILNYTHKAQIDRKWNDTTRVCRGVIYETRTSGKYVVARAYPKFFNINDPDHPETSLAKLKEYENKGYKGVLTEKLDGSLGLFWAYEDGNFNVHYGIATRGSFTSPQAVWATKYLEDHRRHNPINWSGEFTPVCEIIYPENRIVVDYAFKGLVITGMVRILEGSSVPYVEARAWARRRGFPCVKRVNKGLDEILAEDIPGAEGYVYTSGLSTKVKIKFPTYCKLHKIITGWSPKDVWQILKDKALYDELFGTNIPQHFKDWFCKWRNTLRVEYNLIEQRAKEAYAGLELGRPRGAIAKDVLGTNWADKRIIPVLFKMLDNKPYDDVIWKQIKPKGLDRPVTEEGAA